MSIKANNTDVGLSNLEAIATEIREKTAEVEVYFIKIGKLLNQAKAEIEDGCWLAWLEKNTTLNRSVASRFMRLAKAFPDGPPVAHLGFTKTLLLLDVPADRRDSFIKEPLMLDGQRKEVCSLSKRELEEVIRSKFKTKLKNGNF